MAIDDLLKEFKSIEERFLTGDQPVPSEPKQSEEKPEEVPSEETPDEMSDEEVFSKDVDNIEGESAENIADALDMLLSVILASAERVQSIIDQVIADESVELNNVFTSDILDKLSKSIEDLQQSEADVYDLQADEEEKLEDLVDEPEEPPVDQVEEPAPEQA